MRHGYLLLGLVFILGCRKADPVYPFEQENVPIEGLTAEQDSIIASQPATTFSPSEILLEDGETLEQFLQRTDPNALLTWGQRISSVQRVTGLDKKLSFVSGIFSEGFRLTDTIKHPFRRNPEPDLPGPAPLVGTQPGQFGYAYVYGSRDVNSRHRAGQCDIWLYGLDCSGMASSMLRAGGMQIGSYDYNADGLSKEYNLNTLLLKSPNLKDFGYEYEEKPQSFLDKVTEGDIIFFKDENGLVDHVGIALIPATHTDIYIYQSNGARERFPRRGKGCDVYENRERRGPRCVPIRSFIGLNDFSRYGILHLGEKKPLPAELLGDWFLSEQVVALIVGGINRPIVPVKFTKMKFSFGGDNTFHIEAEDEDDPGNPYTCDGIFVMYNNNKNMNLNGSCVYEKTNLSAEVIELNSASLKLHFFARKSRGVAQDITLKFHR